MFDLDRFKTINDTFGHATGDDVIRMFCKITAAALRPTDIFGRIGGEEFAVVMPRSGVEAAFVRAERIRAAFAEECGVVNGHPVNATASGGVSVSIDTETSLSLLLKHSDDALYRAKAAGRNRIKRADQLAPGNAESDVIRVA
jgi:diguanylate cyclase (GGDEF)-like protein